MEQFPPVDEQASPTTPVTEAELLQLIELERQKHALELETLAAQKSKLQSLLDKQKHYFRELITRVTELRVKVSELEFELEENGGGNPASKMSELDVDSEQRDRQGTSSPATGSGPDTGSARVDKALSRGLMMFVKSKSKFGPLLRALDAAVQPEGTPEAREGQAYPPLLEAPRLKHMMLHNKTTSVFFVSRNEIRGTKSWWEKHAKQCSACHQRAKEVMLQQRQQDASTAVGEQYIPHLGSIRGKTCHTVTVFFQREPSLDSREDERSIEALRMSAIVGVTNVDGRPLANPEAEARTAERVLSESAKQALQVLIAKMESSKWMSPDETAVSSDDNGDSSNAIRCSSELRVAVEIFIHSIGVTTSVAVVEQRTDMTFLRVNVALTLPIHVACIRPLLEAARAEAQRRILSTMVFKPLVETMCRVVGLESRASFFVSVLEKSLEAVNAFRKESEEQYRDQTTQQQQQQQQPKLRQRQLYNIVHALCLHQSRLSVVVAVPPLDAAASRKEKTMDIAAEVLRLFVAPNGVHLPAAPAPDLVDFIVRLDQFPTNVLEVLNQTFSSPDRIPSGRRIGALDAVVSPQTKISLGLKLFGEIVVDVYRPYAPGCGAVITEEEEKTQSFFKKSPLMAPECSPRADLPPDLVKSNVTIHEQARRLLLRLDEEKQRKVKRDVEQQAQELLENVRTRVVSGNLLSSVKDETAALGWRPRVFYEAEVGVLLPFAMDSSDAGESKKPVLYAVAQLKEKDS